MRSQPEIDAILLDVQRRLDAKRKATGVALHVPTGGYVEHDDWLNVVVEPDNAGLHAYQYVEALGEVEKELRGSGMDKIILVPAIAD